MQTGDELLHMIEEEINETERRLQFWRDQEHAQAGTHLGKRIPAIVDSYDRSFAILRPLESYSMPESPWAWPERVASNHWFKRVKLWSSGLQFSALSSHRHS